MTLVISEPDNRPEYVRNIIDLSSYINADQLEAELGKFCDFPGELVREYVKCAPVSEERGSELIRTLEETILDGSQGEGSDFNEFWRDELCRGDITPLQFLALLPSVSRETQQSVSVMANCLFQEVTTLVNGGVFSKRLNHTLIGSEPKYDIDIFVSRVEMVFCFHLLNSLEAVETEDAKFICQVLTDRVDALDRVLKFVCTSSDLEQFYFRVRSILQDYQNDSLIELGKMLSDELSEGSEGEGVMEHFLVATYPDRYQFPGFAGELKFDPLGLKVDLETLQRRFEIQAAVKPARDDSRDIWSAPTDSIVADINFQESAVVIFDGPGLLENLKNPEELVSLEDLKRYEDPIGRDYSLNFLRNLITSCIAEAQIQELMVVDWWLWTRELVSFMLQNNPQAEASPLGGDATEYHEVLMAQLNNFFTHSQNGRFEEYLRSTNEFSASEVPRYVGTFFETLEFLKSLEKPVRVERLAKKHLSPATFSKRTFALGIGSFNPLELEKLGLERGQILSIQHGIYSEEKETENYTFEERTPFLRQAVICAHNHQATEFGHDLNLTVGTRVSTQEGMAELIAPYINGGVRAFLMPLQSLLPDYFVTTIKSSDQEEVCETFEDVDQDIDSPVKVLV